MKLRKMKNVDISAGARRKLRLTKTISAGFKNVADGGINVQITARWLCFRGYRGNKGNRSHFCSLGNDDFFGISRFIQGIYF